MENPRSIVIFAEPNTIVSDGLVPNAVKQIEKIQGLHLEGIINVKENSDPEQFTGRLNYLKYYFSKLSEPSYLAWEVYRRVRGFQNPNFPPYPSTLSWDGFPDSIHLEPPEIDVRHPDFVSYIKSINPDIILLLGCGKILGEELIEIPSLGVINYHWSYLPEYRGRHVTYWAAYYQEEYSGITYHMIDPDIDQGTRICAERVRVRKGGPTLSYDSIISGRTLLTPVLRAISEGKVPNNGTIQGGEYYSAEKYNEEITEFDPSRDFEHNSRVLSAKEECLVKFENGTWIIITGVESGPDSKVSGRYGEVLGIERRGVQVNIGGEPHYISSMFHLPAYPLAKLLRIKEGMVIQVDL